MPSTYFVVGSFYGGSRLDRLLNILHDDANYRADVAVLMNHQLGTERKPSGFAQIYNSLIDCAFADKNCRFVWILGDDVEPQGLCLRQTEAAIDPSMGAIFPVEAWYEPFSMLPGAAPITIEPFTGKQLLITEAMVCGAESIDQMYAGFACACITRPAWEAVGHMDESLGRGYAEDLDWGIRCWKAGFRVVNYRRSWFLHERGATYNRLVADKLYDDAEPYEASERCRLKHPFLWNAEWPVTRIMDMLRSYAK